MDTKQTTTIRIADARHAAWRVTSEIGSQRWTATRTGVDAWRVQIAETIDGQVMHLIEIAETYRDHEVEYLADRLGR